MKRVFGGQSQFFKVPDLTYSLIDFNLKRISFFSIILFIFQLANLFITKFYNIPAYLAGIISCLVLSFGYLVYLKFFYKANPLKASFNRIIYISFWILFCFAMTPFFIGDIMGSGVYINLVIYCAAMSATPILTVVEASLIYGVFLVTNFVIGFYFNQPLSFFSLVVLLFGSGLTISQINQSQYLSLILKLKKETNTDFLTEILNRKGGLEKMQTVLEMCKRHDKMFAIAIVDIDHFKNYNDQFGHLAGDICLKKIAQTIAKSFSRSSDVVCRLGGEEFLVCFTGNNEKFFIQEAENLRLAIHQLEVPSAENGVSPFVTISIGLTSYIPNKDLINVTESELMERADNALYIAKRTGRNCVVYNH